MGPTGVEVTRSDPHGLVLLQPYRRVPDVPQSVPKREDLPATPKALRLVSWRVGPVPTTFPRRPGTRVKYLVPPVLEGDPFLVLPSTCIRTGGTPLGSIRGGGVDCELPTTLLGRRGFGGDTGQSRNCKGGDHSETRFPRRRSFGG